MKSHELAKKLLSLPDNVVLCLGNTEEFRIEDVGDWNGEFIYIAKHKVQIDEVEMVKFKINLDKTKIDVIDDAEGTPGSSRQYTRFNAEVKNKVLEALKEDGSIDTVSKILNENEFKVVDLSISNEGFYYRIESTN